MDVSNSLANYSSNVTVCVVILVLVSMLFLCNNGKACSRWHIRSLDSKHVVITGGSSGIGFALAKECLSQGAFVTLMARTPSKLSMASQLLTTTLNLHPDRILLKAVDVSDATAVGAAIMESFEWRAIDILICNAGIAISGPFDGMKVEELDAVTKTNILGCVYPVNAALPLMKARSMQNPSAIVLMSSISCMLFITGANMYTSTKYALKGLAEVLRFELLPHHIKVNLVCPGFTETPMLDEVDNATNLTSYIFKKIAFYDRAHAESVDKVAAKTIHGLKRGEFLITTSMGGFLIGVLGRGVIPTESVVQALLEIFLIIPMRILSFVWFAYVKRTIIRSHNNENFKH